MELVAPSPFQTSQSQRPRIPLSQISPPQLPSTKSNLQQQSHRSVFQPLKTIEIAPVPSFPVLHDSAVDFLGIEELVMISAPRTREGDSRIELKEKKEEEEEEEEAKAHPIRSPTPTVFTSTTVETTTSNTICETPLAARDPLGGVHTREKGTKPSSVKRGGERTKENGEGVKSPGPSTRGLTEDDRKRRNKERFEDPNLWRQDFCYYCLKTVRIHLDAYFYGRIRRSLIDPDFSDELDYGIFKVEGWMFVCACAPHAANVSWTRRGEILLTSRARDAKGYYRLKPTLREPGSHPSQPPTVPDKHPKVITRRHIANHRLNTIRLVKIEEDPSKHLFTSDTCTWCRRAHPIPFSAYEWQMFTKEMDPEHDREAFRFWNTKAWVFRCPGCNKYTRSQTRSSEKGPFKNEPSGSTGLSLPESLAKALGMVPEGRNG